MKQFFKENKTFIAIIIAAFIIGGFIYLSKEPNKTPSIPEERTLLPNIETPEIRPQSLVSQCINFKEAENYIGEFKCVIGKVDNVYISSKGNIFLNFCPDYRTCPFSAVIFRSDSYKFSNPKQYEGKIVEIRGLIKTYKGRAEIIINDPNQIELK
mgnify:CR=1 FL=1